MVRWSIVHKCQILIKHIFNNIEVNCIWEIVPQTIFHRGGAKLTHLADWLPLQTQDSEFKEKEYEGSGQMVNTTARVFLHVVFYYADG